MAHASPALQSAYRYDAVIVGSGLAGLSTALKLLENRAAPPPGASPFRIAS